jgi:hypothetical protein
MTTPIDLMLDTDNELRFKVNIEGTRPGSSVCRLMLESEDLQYGFKGTEMPDGEISIFIPPLKNILKEGTYDTHLEVVVDDRIFIPLELSVNFEKSMTVTAESVVRPKRSKVSASAVLVEAPDTVQTPTRTLKEIQKSKTKANNRKKQRSSKTPDTNSIDGKQILELLKTIKTQKDRQ